MDDVIIGLNTACLQKRSSIQPRQLVEFTLSNEFAGIEFRDEYPFFESMSRSDEKWIRSTIDRNGLLGSVHLSFYDLNIGSFRFDIRMRAVESHRSTVKRAADLGATLVTVHGGKMSGSFYTDESSAKVDELSGDSISLIRETCEEVGVTLCVENMSLFTRRDYKSYVYPESLVDLYNQQEGKIKVTFDLGHAASVIPRIQDYVEALGPEKIGLSHLSDNNLQTDQHIAVGAGDIDYQSFMSRYVEKGWDFPFFIETTTAEQALESKKYLEEIIMKTPVPHS